MQEGMEGNPIAATMKNVMRGLAIATVPLTMNFPKVFAIFLYQEKCFCLFPSGLSASTGHQAVTSFWLSILLLALILMFALSLVVMII